MKAIYTVLLSALLVNAPTFANTISLDQIAAARPSDHKPDEMFINGNWVKESDWNLAKNGILKVTFANNSAYGLTTIEFKPEATSEQMAAAVRVYSPVVPFPKKRHQVTLITHNNEKLAARN